MELTSSLIVSGDEFGTLYLWDLTRPPETLPWSKTRSVVFCDHFEMPFAKVNSQR